MEESSRRRSDRILAPIRIRVIGNDMSGVSFAEETVTVSFSRHGARISLTHSLLPDDVILIMNIANGIEEEFRVVGGLQQVFGDRREWGLEALNPSGKIWGIESVTPTEGLQPKVAIECAACKTAIQSTLSSIEYDVLLAMGIISRHCSRCGETTRWKPSEQFLLPDFTPAKAEPIPTEKERRSARRLKLSMRVRVRNQWGLIEIAHTKDVCRNGLRFVSQKVFGVGEEIYITLPFADHQTPVETKGAIVWTSKGPAGRYHGVKYLR
jgi:hypothetical protein